MLNAHNLGSGDIALLIQGESLPKDSFTQLTLYPHTPIEHIQRIQILLAKVLQLILGFGISEREVRYLLTHAADFDNLDLSKLPVNEINDATVLFQRFLRLANYALLKRDLASNTDDLIGVFETKRLDEIDKGIGNLTRRDPNTIQATIKALALSISDFANEQGFQRLWEGLQLIEKLGVPAEAIARWTDIVKIPKTPGEEKGRIDIARDLKNTVKARYEPDNWQRIAQPIFDNLRQRQRDALVAYILHRRGFDRLEQLFEYFLIDPGMEPVVQTSRIRLAISSIQIFIQRCLLNLEPKVHPSVINSKQWQWMKRYRVWEANRKIFLFPENWLEPEFRDDKTHLFQELEGALLQGDVSNDLAEDAFFQYLKKLKELAKLDIVTMYCEEKPDSSLNTLHVIGAWKDAPFRPHVVARYRQTAYMFKTVMAYLDNLIDWGDSLFRQDTGESIDEALMLYVLAVNILGPRPQAVPKKGSVRPQTYASLKKDLNEFGNALAELEASIPFDIMPHPNEEAAEGERFGSLSSIGKALYFCVPRNDKLLSYWDTVADRLFKIRNSLNIQGIFRQLALFEPPIDPALLARAAAAGLDVGAIVSGINQPLPLVRFQLLVQKAPRSARK